MSPQQLEYCLNQIWITGVAYGRRFPGEAPALSDADFLAVRDSLFSMITDALERRGQG